MRPRAHPRLEQGDPVRLATALVFGALALSGCADNQVLKADSSHSPHTVRLTVTSTEMPARLTYRIGSAPTKAMPVGAKFAATTIKVASGTRVAMTGGPPTGSYTVSGTGSFIPSDTFTCTIAVDGVVRTTRLAQVPLGASPPTCSAAGYVGSRPFQVRRLLEYLAVALCLLIVIFGIAVQVMPARRRG
jgi:hypothetical protein